MMALGRGLAAAERRAQLSQRRQDPGVERAAGHAPAADARPSHDAGAAAARRRCWSSAAAPASPPARSRSIRVVEHETIAEIEPLVPQRRLHLLRRAQLRRRPQPEGARPDRRCAALSADDAARSSTRSRPIRSIPWVKGAAMLYTREFFEDVKAHLNPGGVVTLFVQLYESNTEAVKSEMATFFEAFPERRGVRQHRPTARATTSCCSGRSSRRRSTSTRSQARLKQSRVRADGAVAARDRLQFGGRSVLAPTPAARRI